MTKIEFDDPQIMAVAFINEYEEIQVANIEGRNVGCVPPYIRIGCEQHSIEDWESFDDRRILEMDGKEGLKFWRANKKQILAKARALFPKPKRKRRKV